MASMFNAFLVASGPRIVFSAKPLAEIPGMRLAMLERFLAPAPTW
jgi:hypothetical protein